MKRIGWGISLKRIVTGIGFVAWCTVSTASAAPLQYVSAVLADGPVGYWSLEEKAGTTAIDNSASSLNGTYNGPTLGQSGAMPLYAPLFDGANDYVQIADAAPLDVTDLTLEAWISWNGTSGERVILNKESTYMFAVKNGAFQAAVEASGPGSWFWVGTQPISMNTWTHVVATYDSSTGILSTYVNGVLDTAMFNQGGAVLANNNPLQIGKRSIGSFFGGGIDEVAVYDSVLTPTQIAAHYSAAVVPIPAAAWLFGGALGALGWVRRRQAAA
jgi:hypothetical protein